MNLSPITSRTNIKKWEWWQLPPLLRGYVGVVPLAATLLMALAASQVVWRSTDLVKFMCLLACSLISVAATPRMAYQRSGMTRDFITVWVLPVAILLPPFYATLVPIPLYVLTQVHVHRGIIYRWVFTVGAMALSYGGASYLFHLFPASFAGGTIGSGTHAATWVIAVIVAEQFARRAHQVLIMAAIKLSDPNAQLLKRELSRDALVSDFAEFDLGVVITVVVAVSIALAVIAVPTVLLARRFMMHVPLLEKSRIDTKTGLLNSSTWESEATAEIVRATRMRLPLSVALIDIDHFKRVNDTHGHLAGDRVLRAVTDAIREHLRSYDMAGRFGGEEFVVLLPNAREPDAVSIAERLRTHVEGMAIPITDDGPDGPTVRLTISVGVASLDDSRRELTNLMAAADAALYEAKQTGRNRTRVMPSLAPSQVPADRRRDPAEDRRDPAEDRRDPAEDARDPADAVTHPSRST